MDLVVIGNGIVALATAWRFARSARAGDRVKIIGPAARVGSATMAAAAMLSSFGEVEAGGLDTALGRAHLELARDAQALWPAFAAELASLPELGHGSGTYVVDCEGQGAADVDALIAALVAHGEPHAVIEPSEVPGFAPLRVASRAVRIDREGWIHPRLVMAHLERALRACPQVEIIDGEVDRLRRERGAITTAVLADGREVTGSEFLLAAGAAVTAILERSGLGQAVRRVFYGIGVSLELRSPELAFTHCIRSAARELGFGVYVAPYHSGHVILGATSLVSPEPTTTVSPELTATLLRAAADNVHRAFLGAEVVRVNVGWRPTSEDTYPLLGRTSVDNLVIATGTRRDGFHLSPLLSRHLCALLRCEPGDARLAVFAPERAPIRDLSREQAIAAAVRYKLQRDSVERLHDQLGAHEWGIPPELLELYRDGHVKP